MIDGIKYFINAYTFVWAMGILLIVLCYWSDRTQYSDTLCKHCGGVAEIIVRDDINQRNEVMCIDCGFKFIERGKENG